MIRTAQLDQQLIETVSDNPLKTDEEKTLIHHQPFNFQDKLKDPKIKLLVILVVTMSILLVLALIAAIFRKKPAPVTFTPTPTSNLLPTPTLNQTKIPDLWLKNLNDREDELKTPEDFIPPQIDTEIGQ